MAQTPLPQAGSPFLHWSLDTLIHMTKVWNQKSKVCPSPLLRILHWRKWLLPSQGYSESFQHQKVVVRFYITINTIFGYIVGLKTNYKEVVRYNRKSINPWLHSPRYKCWPNICKESDVKLNKLVCLFCLSFFIFFLPSFLSSLCRYSCL